MTDPAGEMQRPSWKQVAIGTGQAWFVLAVIWYAAVFAGMKDHDRTEPWQQFTPVPLLTLLAGMILVVRFLPPRNYGFADRTRRSLIASIPPTLLVGVIALMQGRGPQPVSFGEGLYEWLFAIFLWGHGWPFMFFPAFYAVERRAILATKTNDE